MKRNERKRILEKQLVLLSEYSANYANKDRLNETSDAMCRVSEAIEKASSPSQEGRLPKHE